MRPVFFSAILAIFTITSCENLVIKNVDVSSEKAVANTYDEGLFSDLTTTSNFDHVVSSGLTAANMYDDASYPERTTPSSHGFDLYPVMTTTSNSDHRISLGQTEGNTYDEGLYPERTTTSPYEFDLYPDMTTISNSDHRISLGQTAANTYAKGLYPERTSTSNFSYAVFPNGSILYRHEHRVYPGSSSRFKYEQSVYPRRTTTYNSANSVYQEKMSASKYANDLNHERVIKSNVYHGGYPEGATLSSNGTYAKKTTTSKYDHGAFPDGTTIDMYDFDGTEDKHHQGQRLTTTNMYSLGINLKRIKRFLSGYGVFPDQARTSTFEWTTIYNYDHSVYPKGFRASKFSHNVGQDGSTENLYENSVTRDPEEKARIVRNQVNNQEFKDFLQECQNGTDLQKLLCYPTLTYNISLVNGVIPYFSDLRIFFADNFQNCNGLFNKFIKTKNNVVSNVEVHDFLTNDSTCLEFASLTNRKVFLTKLNDRGSLFAGLTFPYEKASHIKLYVILRQPSCRCGFNHSDNMNSTQLSDIISIDNLIDFFLKEMIVLMFVFSATLGITFMILKFLYLILRHYIYTLVWLLKLR